MPSPSPSSHRLGFSLISVLVVLALITGIGAIFTNLYLLGVKSHRKAAANFDFDAQMWEVANVLKDPDHCNTGTNLVFKELGTGGVLTRARLSNEAIPATNSVSWVGYQVGSGSSAQKVKIVAEGDSVGNQLNISSITFVRQAAALSNTPVSGQTTHKVSLVITASPVGSGFPASKTFRLILVTESTTFNIIGCSLES